ncbi:MAG TPA: superoxide dismutase family protein [Vicinamibacterales bacterium]|nr:superoxide dismutase family protein [Vicinamibacterales bacterium]
MKSVHVCAVAAAFALAAASAAAQQGSQPQPRPGMRGTQMGNVTARATASLKGEGISGQATFTEREMGDNIVVMIEVSAQGLKPGKHGVHLHAVGKCEPDFTAAGGHFDPGPAGNTDPDANHPFHMGDIPNLTVGEDGKGTLRAMTTRVTLSDGPTSLFDADGTAIIVHGNPDQGITGAPKSGVSGGPRVACGVVTKS